jgi:hypothetical protein
MAVPAWVKMNDYIACHFVDLAGVFYRGVEVSMEMEG